jgi:hypothetical protein
MSIKYTAHVDDRDNTLQYWHEVITDVYTRKYKLYSIIREMRHSHMYHYMISDCDERPYMLCSHEWRDAYIHTTAIYVVKRYTPLHSPYLCNIALDKIAKHPSTINFYMYTRVRV